MTVPLCHCGRLHVTPTITPLRLAERSVSLNVTQAEIHIHYPAYYRRFFLRDSKIAELPLCTSILDGDARSRRRSCESQASHAAAASLATLTSRRAGKYHRTPPAPRRQSAP